MMPVIFEDYLKPIFGTDEGAFILRIGDYLPRNAPSMRLRCEFIGEAMQKN